MKKIPAHFILAAAFSFCSILAHAESNRISLQAENDFWFHKDCDYTHGTRIAYETGDFEFAVQQNMYTPTDKKADYPLPDQHPYGGYLVGEVGYNLTSDNAINHFALQIGLVGPHSYAEQTQKAVHRAIGDIEPMGWDYQIEDEFIIEAIYIYLKDWEILGNKESWGVVLVGKGGGAAGLAQDYAMLGGELRFGYRPRRETDDSIFMVADLREDRFAMYGIIGGEFRAYAYNIFLDGNYSRDSMSVDSIWDVWEGRCGLGFKLLGLDARMLSVFRSKEYETQEHHTQFLSLEIGYSF